MYKSQTEIIGRAVAEAKFIIAHHASVREAEPYCDVKKSTIHKDVVERLPNYYPDLAAEAAVILTEHKNGIGHKSITAI